MKRVIGSYIVIEEINEEVSSDSGLLLGANDVNELRYHKGKVVMPGTDVETVSADDVIYYDKSGSFKMSLNGRAIVVIRERDVVIVL